MNSTSLTGLYQKASHKKEKKSLILDFLVNSSHEDVNNSLPREVRPTR